MPKMDTKTEGQTSQIVDTAKIKEIVIIKDIKLELTGSMERMKSQIEAKRNIDGVAFEKKGHEDQYKHNR